MLLDADIKSQLNQYLQLMEGDVLIKVSAGADSVSSDMLELMDELISMTSRIKVEKADLPRTPSFSVNRIGYWRYVRRYPSRSRIYFFGACIAAG
jgi:NADH-dependent peroxiredoxin subunit F